MGETHITQILVKHCRFRFRGGKQAFGVIWETKDGLVFSSKESHDRHVSGKHAEYRNDLLFIDRDDVMFAEVID
jgi:hypothetical protein